MICLTDNNASTHYSTASVDKEQQRRAHTHHSLTRGPCSVFVHHSIENGILPNIMHIHKHNCMFLHCLLYIYIYYTQCTVNTQHNVLLVNTKISG